MNFAVTTRAEGDQVLFRIIPLTSLWREVMHLDAGEAPTNLASPLIPAKHFLPQLFVERGIQSQTWCLL